MGNLQSENNRMNTWHVSTQQLRCHPRLWRTRRSSLTHSGNVDTSFCPNIPTGVAFAVAAVLHQCTGPRLVRPLRIFPAANKASTSQFWVKLDRCVFRTPQDSTEAGVILPHRKSLFPEGGSEQNSDRGERMSPEPPTTNWRGLK